MPPPNFTQGISQFYCYREIYLHECCMCAWEQVISNSKFSFQKSLIKIYQKITLQTQVCISHSYVETDIDKRLTSVFQGSKCSIIFVKPGSRNMVKQGQQGETSAQSQVYLLPLPSMCNNRCLTNCKQAASKFHLFFANYHLGKSQQEVAQSNC